MDNLMNEIDADLAQFVHPSDPDPFVAIEEITAELGTQSDPIEIDSSINNDHLFEGFFEGLDNENTPSTSPITLEADDIFAQIIPNDHDSGGSTICETNVLTTPLQNNDGARCS